MKTQLVGVGVGVLWMTVHLCLFLAAVEEVNGFAVGTARTTTGSKHGSPLPVKSRRVADGDLVGRGDHTKDPVPTRVPRTVTAIAPSVLAAVVAISLSASSLAWAADYAKKDISGMDLSERDLSNKDFTGVIAKKTNFHNANLQGAVFKGANLEKADFSGANVRAATFVDAALDGATFKDAVAERATFSASILDVADLENVDLTGSMWPSE